MAWLVSILAILTLAGGCISSPPATGLIPAGAARVDISPTNAVRLMGYAARASLPAPTNVAQRIHARALALGAGTGAAVLITVDNCILPDAITEELRARLRRKYGLPPEQIAVSVTHTHSAPCLTGAAPNIFALEISAADQTEIDAYTRFFTDQLEAVAIAALQNRQPARLAWGQGSAAFAKNRRTEGGPVDHDLPLLRVTSPDGRLRAVLVSYACHCTTLGGELNAVHGDWAGAAALRFEREHPDTVALVAIGCGADANPDPRGTLELAERHGETIANEASRLASLPLTALTNPPAGRLKVIQLPFQPHFTRVEWERRATNSGIIGYHARKWLARLDRGEALPATLSYPVQTWVFGNQLAMVFLGGEVVVDYSRRLKLELDPERVWINAYANDVPCYIPSRRILQEGGYEAETSLWYYDRPQRLSPEIEDIIIGTVRELVPESFRFDPKRAESPPSKSPADALLSFRPRSGFKVGLVASEPLIESPVAIDFGADGRLWVCEMRDYPSGVDGSGRPGGRVKVLTDTDGDGRFDRADIIADGLPFPTGLMAWRSGVMVCSAPDVWLIEPGEPAGSGRKSPAPNGEVKTAKDWRANRLLSGFATHNFQARVNGLRWGLDGWVYGSGGLFGGVITVAKTGQVFDCSNRDFRFHPDTGEFEPLAGVSQQGRIRDEFGQWFGNDNSTLLFHFPLPEAYRRRNPYVTAPGARIVLSGDADIGRVFPASRTLMRFNDPQSANRLTSACGPELYRDELFGPDFAGNAFVCEPVHNLVRRARLEPKGISFSESRAADEVADEFLASTDNWFRPVEVRTAPDGCLWVVDMHRFVIEHPRWIPADRLKELDVRAGAATGRIWRVAPTGKKPRKIRDLTKLTPAQLAGVIDSPNGVERDLAHRLLVQRTTAVDASVTNELVRLAVHSPRPACRAQALSVLAGLDALSASQLAGALRDQDPRVVRVVLALTEGRSDLLPALAVLPPTTDPATAFQFLLTLSTFPGPEAAAMVADRSSLIGDEWLRAAWLLAARNDPQSAFRALDRGMRDGSQAPLSPTSGGAEAFAGLIATMVGDHRTAALGEVAVRLIPPDSSTINLLELWATLRLQAEFLRHPDVLAAVSREGSDRVRRSLRRLQEEVTPFALELLVRGEMTTLPEVTIPPAIEVLGQLAETSNAARARLVGLLDVNLNPAERHAVAAALRGLRVAALGDELLARWPARPPGQRAVLLALLLSRDAWTDELLAAVEAGRVTAAEFSPAQRQQLHQHAREAVRVRANSLFPAAASDRAAVVAQFAGTTNFAGNPLRGAAHFDRLCASCHAMHGHGHGVGPDLAPFRDKPPGDFLTAILDPNAAVEPRYVAWTAELKDGRVVTGVALDETSAGLTLIEPGGSLNPLRRSEIARLSPAPRSLMPEGLEAGLSMEQLADLIAWLKSDGEDKGLGK